MRERKPAQVTRIFRGRGVTPDWPEELAKAQARTTVRIGGVEVPRIRFGKEGRGWGPAHATCPDCAAARGELHAPRCDLERCPACRGQALSCGCADEEAVPTGLE